MNKKNGQKLGFQAPVKQKQQSQADFDNQFLENQQESNLPFNNQSLVSNKDKNIAYSQHLPTQSDVNKIKRNGNNKNDNEEQKRINRLNSGMQKLSVSILEMKQKYKDLDMEEVLFKKRSEQKEKQIKQFLSQIKAQKMQRNKKKKKRMQRQAKSLQQSINLQQIQKKKKPILLVQQNLKKLKQLKQVKQMENNEKAQKDKKIQLMYQKIYLQQKQKPKYHIRMMEEDKKNNAKKIQYQRQYLAKRKENFKPLQMQELQSHGKRHEELLQQLETVKRSQKQEQYLKILQQNKKLQQFYRGRSYDIVLEQIQQRKVKKVQPNEKYKKMKNYQQYVRQNFIPKTQSKQTTKDEEEGQMNRSSMSHREVKRYRYLQGVSYGQVTENRPLAKTQQQQRKMGNQYMAYMRSLPKKRNSDTDDFQQNPDKSMSQVKLLPKKPNPLAERSGRKSMDVKISEKPTRDELWAAMQILKNKDKQVKRKEKVIKYSGGGSNEIVMQKQADEEFFLNMQRKFNLLSKL